MERLDEVEKELQYYKEMFEIEKETNELNEIKLKELDLMNTQDRQKHEREMSDLKLKFRRLETSLNAQKTNESASNAFRQRIRQLEVEVSSLTERVRIAENLATKYEEDCRAKDFKIREQVKDYEICLSKCNALELMLMSNSQMESSISLGQSITADGGDHALDSPNGKVLNFGDYVVDKHCSPNTDTTCDTAPQSPSIVDEQRKSDSLNVNGFDNAKKNATVNGTSHSNGKTECLSVQNKEIQASAENFPNFSNFLDLDKARTYCQSHPSDVENLLKFAEMVKLVRAADNETYKSNRLSDGGSSGRIPLAVMSGMDYLRDLQRHFSELASSKSGI